MPLRDSLNMPGGSHHSYHVPLHSSLPNLHSMQPNLLCCDLACSAAASEWKLWPVRYCEDMVQSGGILIRSRHWSHIQHSINFTCMNRMQVNHFVPADMSTDFAQFHSFAPVCGNQWVSVMIGWIPDCLGWWWFNDSYYALLNVHFV